MRTAKAFVSVAAVAVVLAGCGGYQPVSPEDERAAVHMAASPVKIAGDAAEVFELVSSTVTGEDENNFHVTAVLKAKKDIPWENIYIIAEPVTVKGEQKGSDQITSTVTPGPLEAGAEKELTFEVTRYGNPGERTLYIKWLRNRPPGDM